jgi:AcrR family transcriptional regulator
VADGTIYLYFKNKDDILVQFYQYKTRQIFERFRDAVDQPETAEDKLRCLIRVHLQEFQKDRNMAIVYQAETHQNRRLGHEQIKEMSKMYRDIISEVVELGQEEGTIRKDLYMGIVKRFIFAEFNKKTVDLIISEARNLAIKEILPTLKEGDEQGCRWKTVRCLFRKVSSVPMICWSKANGWPCPKIRNGAARACPGPWRWLPATISTVPIMLS